MQQKDGSAVSNKVIEDPDIPSNIQIPIIHSIMENEYKPRRVDVSAVASNQAANKTESRIFYDAIEDKSK